MRRIFLVANIRAIRFIVLAMRTYRNALYVPPDLSRSGLAWQHRVKIGLGTSCWSARKFLEPDSQTWRFLRFSETWYLWNFNRWYYLKFEVISYLFAFLMRTWFSLENLMRVKNGILMDYLINNFFLFC